MMVGMMVQVVVVMAFIEAHILVSQLLIAGILYVIRLVYVKRVLDAYGSFQQSFGILNLEFEE
jgi:hypothetical protein